MALKKMELLDETVSGLNKRLRTILQVTHSVVIQYSVLIILRILKKTKHSHLLQL